MRGTARAAGAAAVALTALLAGCGPVVGTTSDTRPAVVLRGDGVVIIAPGDSGRAIGRKLQDAGVTRADHFTFMAQRDPEAGLIQPGTYRLDTGIDPQQALEQLLDPTRKATGLVVPEGARMERILGDLAQRLGLPVARVRKAADKLARRVGPLEGYLYPATYDVDGLTPEQALQTMRDRFNQQDLDQLTRQADEVGLTLEQAVTLASIIQAEVRPRDFRKASRVIHNRLRDGVPLQVDATVNYALGSSTLELSKADLSVDSPYNTYLHTGLPPGPIGSPGAQALRAAVSPADGDWLYWVAVDPEKGTTEFASTYEQFQQLKSRYQAWLDARP